MGNDDAMQEPVQMVIDLDKLKDATDAEKANALYVAYSELLGRFESERWMHRPVHSEDKVSEHFRRIKYACDSLVEKGYLYVTDPTPWQ